MENSTLVNESKSQVQQAGLLRFSLLHVIALATAIGIGIGVGGIVAWNFLRPRTMVEELRAAAAKAEREEGAPLFSVPDTEFRGKKIPFDHALILGLLNPAVPVTVYEDLSSIPTLNWKQAEVDDAIKKGWISKLSPMLLVRVLERGNNSHLVTYYDYKTSTRESDGFLKVEVQEGPMKGQVWWVREIDIVDHGEEEKEAELLRKHARPWGERPNQQIKGLLQSID